MKSAARLFLGLIATLLSAVASPAATNQPAKVPSHSMLTMGGIVTTPERKASPLFDGKRLPDPPRQHDRWSPPRGRLPTNYISATRLLFDQGMADPRGCEYRKIEIGVGSVWTGDAGVVSTHGWVLPGKEGKHFAICWNGLVYPVVMVGTNVDLEADVAALLTNGIASWRPALSEDYMVSTKSSVGIKGCLLLRLGKADLAFDYWLAQGKANQQFANRLRSAGTSDHSSTNRETRLPDADPYQAWATEWTWAMFDRTICAHMRGDERLALFTARTVAESQPQIETNCARRHFERPFGFNFPGEVSKTQPYITFLGPLPELLADLERRGREGNRIKATLDDIRKMANQSARITALINDLDLVQARQWGQPGWVDLAGDPMVEELIKEGDPAVEPLLDCLEHDKRLTRSVGFGRDFHFDRTVIPVSGAAKAAIRSILQAEFADVKETRTYWSKYKGLSLNERCYAILKDDSQSKRWDEAAAHIVQVVNHGASSGDHDMTKSGPTNQPVRLRGEQLLQKGNPSVSELMARRALEVPAQDPKLYDLSAACEMGLKLAVWDPAAAPPVLKTLSKRCATVLKYSDSKMGGLLTKLSLARAHSGETNAFDDYAAWLPTTTPDQLGYSVMEYLSPLESYPTNVVLNAAAEKIFNDANSPWSRLPWQRSSLENPASSGLAKVPVFRALLVRELDRKVARGTVTWLGPGSVGYSMSNYMQGNFTYALLGAQTPTNGASTELRWCDWIAISLSTGKHIPPYNPFASRPDRDRALETIKNSLSKR